MNQIKGYKINNSDCVLYVLKQPENDTCKVSVYDGNPDHIGDKDVWIKCPISIIDSLNVKDCINVAHCLYQHTRKTGHFTRSFGVFFAHAIRRYFETGININSRDVSVTPPIMFYSSTVRFACIDAFRVMYVNHGNNKSVSLDERLDMVACHIKVPSHATFFDNYPYGDNYTTVPYEDNCIEDDVFGMCDFHKIDLTDLISLPYNLECRRHEYFGMAEEIALNAFKILRDDRHCRMSIWYEDDVLKKRLDYTDDNKKEHCVYLNDTHSNLSIIGDIIKYCIKLEIPEDYEFGTSHAYDITCLFYPTVNKQIHASVKSLLRHRFDSIQKASDTRYLVMPYDGDVFEYFEGDHYKNDFVRRYMKVYLHQYHSGEITRIDESRIDNFRKFMEINGKDLPRTSDICLKGDSVTINTLVKGHMISALASIKKHNASNPAFEYKCTCLAHAYPLKNKHGHTYLQMMVVVPND